MSQNPLSNMKIDYWYKTLPVIGVVLLIIGLTVEVKGVSNTLVQLVSLGVIFVGIEEWINHPLQTQVVPGWKVTSYNRINTFFGNLWGLCGIAIILYGFYIERTVVG